MIIYGSELALRYKADIREKVNKYKEEGKRIPKLGVILVGDNPASVSYVKGKRKACEDTGMAFELKELKDTVSQDELIAEIEKWNDDETTETMSNAYDTTAAYNNGKAIMNVNLKITQLAK